jgi:hypothetical protein
VVVKEMREHTKQRGVLTSAEMKSIIAIQVGSLKAMVSMILTGKKAWL